MRLPETAETKGQLWVKLKEGYQLNVLETHLPHFRLWIGRHNTCKTKVGFLAASCYSTDSCWKNYKANDLDPVSAKDVQPVSSSPSIIGLHAVPSFPSKPSRHNDTITREGWRAYNNPHCSTQQTVLSLCLAALDPTRP